MVSLKNKKFRMYLHLNPRLCLGLPASGRCRPRCATSECRAHSLQTRRASLRASALPRLNVQHSPCRLRNTRFLADAKIRSFLTCPLFRRKLSLDCLLCRSWTKCPRPRRTRLHTLPCSSFLSVSSSSFFATIKQIVRFWCVLFEALCLSPLRDMKAHC